VPASLARLPIKAINPTKRHPEAVGCSEHVEEESRSDMILEMEAGASRQGDWCWIFSHGMVTRN
jgi:hypothetical protein